MDNYTKMILGFAVSKYLSFQVVKEAIQNALNTINLLSNEKVSYFISDGGSENNNRNITLFLSQLGDIKLTQLTALKDIIFFKFTRRSYSSNHEGKISKKPKF